MVFDYINNKEAAESNEDDMDTMDDIDDVREVVNAYKDFHNPATVNNTRNRKKKPFWMM